MLVARFYFRQGIIVIVIDLINVSHDYCAFYEVNLQGNPQTNSKKHHHVWSRMSNIDNTLLYKVARLAMYIFIECTNRREAGNSHVTSIT